MHRICIYAIAHPCCCADDQKLYSFIFPDLLMCFHGLKIWSAFYVLAILCRKVSCFYVSWSTSDLNVICLCGWQSVGGGMLQTWLDMSSKMHMSFSFPQLMASMPTQELHLLELDTRREEGMHRTKQSCYKALLPISLESQWCSICMAILLQSLFCTLV